MREALQGIDMVFQQADTLEAGLDMLVGALDAYSGNDRASLLFAEAYLASLRDPRLSQELAGVLVDFRRRLAGALRRFRAGYSEPRSSSHSRENSVAGLFPQASRLAGDLDGSGHA